MAGRPLPGLRWPLPQGEWPWLCCELGVWRLRGRAEEVQDLARVDVVLDRRDSLYLRLRWRRAPGLRSWLWPAQCHVWLTRAQLPTQWPLLRAHLWPSRRQHWLGAP